MAVEGTSLVVEQIAVALVVVVAAAAVGSIHLVPDRRKEMVQKLEADLIVEFVAEQELELRKE